MTLGADALGTAPLAGGGPIYADLATAATTTGSAVETHTVERTVSTGLGTRSRDRMRLDRNQWELATIGAGFAVGGVANSLTGNVIGYGASAAGGAVVFYVWGLWLWNQQGR